MKTPTVPNPQVRLPRVCRFRTARHLAVALASCLAASGLATAKLACRLSSSASSNADIAAHVVSEFGAGSGVADWNQIKADYAGNLAAFYAETGLGNGQSALVTVGGSRYEFSNMHYFVERADSGWPSGLYYDQIDSNLFLMRWHDVVMPVVTSVTYRLSAPVSAGTDVSAWLTQQHGVGSVIVDWDEIKGNFLSGALPFYRQTGLANGALAFVTRNGQHYGGGTYHYYVYHSDAGPPGGGTLDSFDTLYLQRWDLTLPVVYKLVPPAKPDGMAASDGTSQNHVSVTWTHGGVLSYEVWRSTTNDTATATMIGSGITAASYQDATASGGVTYFYWVKAVGVGGTSIFSSPDSGYRQLVVSLSTPATWRTNAAGSFQISVTANGPWATSSNRNWIDVAPPVGNGNGQATVDLTANAASMLTREGTVTIGGATHAVTQEGVVVAAGAPFRLTAAVSDTGDFAAALNSAYGPDATLADWDAITGHAGGWPVPFYQNAPLVNQAAAFVSRGGSRWSGGRQYFIQRFDEGKPGYFYQYDWMYSLYLGAWNDLVMPIVARMRYRTTFAVSDPANTDATAVAVFGTGAVVAEWNTIKANYAANPERFLAHSGLRDQHAAWVKYYGTVGGAGSSYFIQRFDLGKPSYFSDIDQFGTIYLGFWNGMSMPIMADVSATGNGTRRYADWIRNFTVISLEDRDPGDDCDGDGADNLLEYSSGGDPTVADTATRLYQLTPSPNGVFTARLRINPNAAGYTRLIEWSPNLVNWLSSGGRYGTTVVTLGVSVLKSTPYPPGGPRLCWGHV